MGMKTSHVRHSSARGARSQILPEINRSEVARQLNLTRSHISKIFAGKVSPSVEVLSSLAKLLGVSMEELSRRVKMRNSGDGMDRQ